MMKAIIILAISKGTKNKELSLDYLDIREYLKIQTLLKHTRKKQTKLNYILIFVILDIKT